MGTINPKNLDADDLPKSLFLSILNAEILDGTGEIGEAILDNWTEDLIDNEAVQNLPIVKYIIGVVKGTIAVKDRLYVRRVVNVLAETSKATQKDRERFRQKLDKDPKEADKVGEILLNIIDRVTSSEKARMVGKIIRAYMHEEKLDNDYVIYLCEIVERTHLRDLEGLKMDYKYNEANLEAVGLMKPMRVEDVNSAIEALNSRVMKAMPVVRESPINDDADPKVIQSGFTEAGYDLKRILNDY